MTSRHLTTWVSIRIARRLGGALLLSLALSSCVEEPAPTNQTVAPAETAAQAPEPEATTPSPVSPQSTPAPAAAATETAATAPAEPQTPGGLMVTPGVKPDPSLAATADSGQATAVWGGSGRSVDSEAPWRALAYDGIHDKSSDAVNILQQPRTALRSLPRANSGDFIDWAAAIRTGAIRPRANAGSQGQMEVLDLDIQLTDTKTMPLVTFPHRTHTEWLACSNCHDWLFKAQRGANDISMTDIARGRACGMCHGKVAFPATECFRCHNGPRPKA